MAEKKVAILPRTFRSSSTWRKSSARTAIDRDPFSLLALFLSPWKDAKTIAGLRELSAEPGVIDWGGLVYLANYQFCTPLWYARLRQDELLDALPEDLQEYLKELYLANQERNQEFGRQLARLLGLLHAAGITPLLLKGAASLCDDLYGAEGARVMGDADILVAEDQAQAAASILESLGYQEIADPGMAPDGLPTDSRHHQLPRYCLPGSPVAVEIHFRLAYGQAGRALEAVAAFRAMVPARLGVATAHILDPTHRLLHNAVHALIPHREFIRSEISLLQLTEFAQLARRYQADIDWPLWLTLGQKAGLRTQLLAYLELACRLLLMPTPAGVTIRGKAKLEARRLEIACRHTIAGPPGTRESYLVRLLRGLILSFGKVYYYASLPLWIWRNLCYAEGLKNIPLRLRYMVKKAANQASRAKAGY